MFHKYMISVDGNNLLAYAEDMTIFCNFLVKLFSYYKGKKIEIKKVRYYDDAVLHEFLHGYDLVGEDFVILSEKLQVFGQPYFDEFLLSLPYKDSDSCFVDYLSYSKTSEFIFAIQDYEISQEGD